MADAVRHTIRFTGFDSAWGAHNNGAICDLVLSGDGSLQLDGDPVVADWNHAIARCAQLEAADLHVWAVDQPICVRNERGCRPVEQDFARALMADFGCGAFPSNLRNPCWQPTARIWEFVRALEEKNFLHNPLAVPDAKVGRYYFECYPHPALLGVFDLDHIVKYKIRHKDPAEWRRVIDLLRSLVDSELPVRNMCSFVQAGLAHSKANEDRVDALISAYTAAYWWKFGMERSTMIGDLIGGYIVTPHSSRTYSALAKVFNSRMNLAGPACTPPEESLFGQTSESGMHRPTRAAASTDLLPMEPLTDWSNPVELTATDTSNIWRTSRGVVINSWMAPERMTGCRLWVRFIAEDGQPAVVFMPFESHGNEQCGMKASSQQMNMGIWSFLASGATRTNPLRFQICYTYQQIQQPYTPGQDSGR